MLNWFKGIASGFLSLVRSGLKKLGSLIKQGIGWLWGLLRTAKLAGVHMDATGVVHAKFSLDEGKVSISSKQTFSLTLGEKSIAYNLETNQITVQL